MVAHFVIDYPEARAVAQHLFDSRGIKIENAWPHFGWHPNTQVAKLRPVPDEPFLVVNGSGNYHHETYAILEGLSLKQHCAYVHIDAHPDKDTYFRWKLDCASFVGAIAEIPEVQETILLGLHVTPDLYDMPGLILGNDINYYRFDYFAKLRQYHARAIELGEAHFRYTRHDGVVARRNASVMSARSLRLPKNAKKKDRGLVVQWRDLSAFEPASIAADQVYISVDLDVLRNDVVTDWRRYGDQSQGPTDNQGDLRLEELLQLIARIGANKPVIGADICGLTQDYAQLDPALLQHSMESIGQVYDALIGLLSQTR